MFGGSMNEWKYGSVLVAESYRKRALLSYY